MGRTIEKKILKPYADAVLAGEKNFEIRFNDEGYQRGDIIRFKVMDSEMMADSFHKLNGKEYLITYVLSGYGLQEGYVVLGIQQLYECKKYEFKNAEEPNDTRSAHTVEVVWCTECKHCDKCGDTYNCVHPKGMVDVGYGVFSFCSYGERREDADIH